MKQESAIRKHLGPVMFVLPSIQGKKLFRLAALCGDSLKGSLCPSEHDEAIREPRAPPLPAPESGSSQMTWGAPPARSTRFNLRSTKLKNATCFESGDQKGK